MKELIKKSFIELKNPLFVFFGLIFYLLILLIEKISLSLVTSMNTAAVLSSELVLVTILSFLVMAFFFSSFVNAALSKPTLKNFINGGKKFFFKNFLIIAITSIIIGMAVLFSNYIAFSIGKKFYLDVLYAKIIFFVIYSFFLLTIPIFLMPAIFLRENFKNSIKLSIQIAKKNYLTFLSISIILLILFKISIFIPHFDIFEYILLIPFLSIFFSRLVKKLK